MKKHLKDINAKHDSLKEEFGLNTEVMNNQCPKGHNLFVHYGMIREYADDKVARKIGEGTKPECDICTQKNLHMHHHFFRCQSTNIESVPFNHYDENGYVESFRDEECMCLYNLCRMCALSTCDPPRLKNDTIWVQKSIHPYQLKKIQAKNDRVWVCHLSKEADPNSKRKNSCLSNISGPG